MTPRDFEMEQHEYFPGLRLRALRFRTDDEIELDFEGLGTADRTFVVRRSPEGAPIQPFEFEEEFYRLYRGVPILTCGLSLDPLVRQAFVVRGDQLPADEAWQRLFDELHAELTRRWEETQADGG